MGYASIENLYRASAQTILLFRECFALEKCHGKGTWGRDMELKDMRTVIDAMIEDVAREARGEIVDSRDARAAIGTRTAQMFKRRVTAVTL